MKGNSLVRGIRALALTLTVASPAVGETFDSDHGYVTLTQGETASSLRSLYSAGYWSDGQAPHSGTNYYVASVLDGKAGTLVASQVGDYTFPGDVLCNSIFWFSGMTSGTMTIPKWIVLCDQTKKAYYAKVYCDRNDSAVVYRPVFAGDLTVLQQTANAFFQIGYDANDKGMDPEDSFTFLTTLHGAANAIINVRSRSYTKASCSEEGGVRFFGDNSDYRGLFRVLKESRLALGCGEIPATVALCESTSGLVIEGADGATASLTRLVATNLNHTTSTLTSRVNVAPTNTLALGGLEIWGKLVKLGGGTLGVGGLTANTLSEKKGKTTYTDPPAIDVQEGSLRADDATGAVFASVPLSFATGTGVAFDLDSEAARSSATGFRLPTDLTTGDSFTVTFTGKSKSYERRTYALFSGTKAQVEDIRTKLVKVNASSARLFDRYSVEGTDAAAVLKVTFAPAKGFMFIYR